MTEHRPHLDVALATATFAPVFPCLPTNKQPATKHGFHDATTDPARIRSWWGQHPAHMVGIRTEGLVVIDLDEPKDAPPTAATWQWWRSTTEAHRHPWADDLIVATPRGGLHIYFTAPPGTGVRNSAGKLAPLVDVRADGGYVIAPGSRTADGRHYEILNLADPAEAPAWLLDLIAATRQTTPDPGPPPTSDHHGTRYGRQALEAELGRLATATEGQRNDTLVRAAYRCGQLVAGGQLDAHAAADGLSSVALRIGLAESEIAATIRSGLTSGAQHPRRPAA